MNPTRFRFKPRKYLHFDLPIGAEEAARLASSPDRVKHHSFYPFIGYTVTTEKIQRVGGEIVRRTKAREIKFAAHRDAAIYSYYAQVLEARHDALLENRGLSSVVTAFRSLPTGGTNIEFAKEVFDFIDRHRPCVALAFDIEKFFDNLDHELLKQRWCDVLGVGRLSEDHFSVWRSLTRFAWVSKDELFKTLGISPHNPKPKHIARLRICQPHEFRTRVRGMGLLRANPIPGRGIPQGSPISAVLSNVYMLEFDSAVHKVITGLGGLYRRYCDDIMIVIPSDSENLVRELVRTEITKIRLNVNDAKTDRASFPPGLGVPGDGAIQYLGFTYDGARKLLRLGSLNRYYGKMRRGVSLAKQTQRKHNRRESADGTALTPLRCRKLYLHYSYLITRRARLKKGDPKAHGNFLTYAYRAADVLGSPDIRRQVRGHWKKLQQAIQSPIWGQLRDP